ncbi:MAG: SDR family NAD(P)-dependent oxidoreductase, partial [Klebsiella sp.]|nr:SDR family NAD(P)-dependent oxidoreductase [Klebsiella sp.]
DEEAQAGGDKSLKTVNAIRQVPIHPRLIELGLLEYVDALKVAGYDRLFPELKHNKIKGYTQNRQPGIEADMEPKPIAELEEYKAAGKLENKVALITGGDSGIGRAIAILYAKEGANVAIGYYDEHQDAEDTVNRLQEMGVKAKAYAHDLKDEKQSQKLIKDVINDFGSLNILVNNGGVQFPRDHFEDITPQQVKETFMTNIFGMIHKNER